MPVYKTIQDIKNNKLFSGIKEAVLIPIFDQKEIREAREGEVIYKTGDQSNSLFLIIKGDLRVKFPSNNYVSNKIFNDFFGEKELMDETRRISSAVAFSRLIYYKLDKATFKSLMSKHPAIGNNLQKYGELKLPDVSIDLDRKFGIVDRKKPISFRAFSNKQNAIEEVPDETEMPAVVTQQFIPDLDSIEAELPVEDTMEIKSDLVSENEEELKKELIEDPEDFKNWQFEESKQNQNATELVKDTKPVEQTERETHTEKHKAAVPAETGINREVVRKILAGTDRIYSSISLDDLVKNTNRAVKDLTNSEGVDLILIDEKLSSMQRIIFEGDKVKKEFYPLTDGLTVSAALQKKVLNFERPTEDTRFNVKVDQPGPARLKRIVYFPVVNDNGETIAVLRLQEKIKSLLMKKLLTL